MTTHHLRLAAACAAAAVALAACDRDTMANADREGRQIGQKSDQALATAKEKLSEMGRRTGEALDRAGEKTQQALSEAGARGQGVVDRGTLSDTAITASIKTDFLKDPDLSVLKIDVDTREGVVTLNGLAENDAARQRAEYIARGVKGVREVRNYLVVKKA